MKKTIQILCGVCLFSVALLLLDTPSISQDSPAINGPLPQVLILKAKGYLRDVKLSELASMEFNEDDYEEELERAQQCGHPDYVDREIVDASIEQLEKVFTNLNRKACEGLQEVHERKLMAPASRSWPKGCHPEFPDHYAVTLYVDKDSFAGMHKREITDTELQQIIDTKVWGNADDIRREYAGKSILDVGLNLCQRAYWRMNLAILIRGPPSRENDANIGMASIYISGGVIGFAYFNDGTCSDHVHNRIDNSWRTGLWGLTDLLAHELGHNMNLDHDFNNGGGQDFHDGVMSYRRRYHFEGFSPGGGDYTHPKDPSHDELSVKYFPKPLPVNHPLNPEKPFLDSTPDPPDPPTGDLVKVGDKWQITMPNGQQVTWVATEVGDTPSDPFSTRLKRELAAIQYEGKDEHRKRMGTLYAALSKSLESGGMTVDRANEALLIITPIVLGDSTAKWSKFLAVAAEATTKEQFKVVADSFGALALGDGRLIEILIGLLENGQLEKIIETIIRIIDLISAQDQTALNTRKTEHETAFIRRRIIDSNVYHLAS